MKFSAIMVASMLFATASSQTGVKVVSSVDLKRYAGIWYEIARLPNSFEKSLQCVTATYSLRDDGKITVLNKGHKISDQAKESSAKGVAWVPDPKVPAKLKVQFFWPFSGNYWIIDLEKDYKYALVGDPSFKYLWILCREKVMDDKTYNNLLEIAVKNGFDVSPILKISQDCR
ncbi:MAG: lipocalin family protein [Bacteroidales bacterium]|jgi:apolipoprotein D and lipocalin family protein